MANKILGVEDKRIELKKFRDLVLARYSDESTPPFRCKVHHFFYDKKGLSQSIPLTGDLVIQT